jgi:hypothetical protein
MFKPMMGGLFTFSSWECVRTPSCSEWLEGRSDQEPDHLCCHSAAKSVRDFLASWGFIQEDSPPYLKTWPLPVGQVALARWGALRAGLELGEGDFIDRLYGWIPIGPVAAEQHREAVSEVSITVSGLEPHPVLASIATDPHNWLLAVAQRKTEAGTVLMLGNGHLSGMVFRCPPEWSKKGTKFTYSWDHTLERIEVYNAVGSWAFLQYSWASGFPYLVTVSVGGGGDDTRVYVGEGRRMKLSALDNLCRESRKLARWWNRLHRKMSHTGRRPGSTAIPDSEFESRYRTAYEKWCETREDLPRRVDIASELGISLTTFYDTFDRLGLHWPPTS